MKNVAIIFVLSSLFLTLFSSCGSTGFVRNKEARDDANEYAIAKKEQSSFKNQFTAQVETAAVTTQSANDDAADDPAIWYNESNPALSVLFGSNKKQGIHSYTLEGKELQFVQIGRINNIDVRQGVALGDENVDILAGSNRSTKSIDFFFIDKKGNIATKPDFSIGLGKFKPYGFCLGKSTNNSLHAFVNDKDGNIYQFSLFYNKDQQLDATMLRNLKLPTQVEGMVVDDEKQLLYVGEEQAGIHIFDAKANGAKQSRLLVGSSQQNEAIRYDVEGLSLFREGNKTYLIASSQGNFSYAIFDLDNEKYVDSFTIIDGSFDGVEETDGLDVLNLPMGDRFPNGVFIVQDGFNFEGEKLIPQNFKVVDLNSIKNLIRQK